MRIYKYEMTSPITWVRVSKAHRILSAAIQNDRPVVWIMIDPEVDALSRTSDTVELELHAVNTGNDLSDEYLTFPFVATATTSNGIVWHIFVREARWENPGHGR